MVDILVGEVVAPFGRKGEVKVVPHTDFPERLKELGQVKVAVGDETLVLEIQNLRLHKDLLLIKFTGYENISDAERLRGGKVFISDQEIAPLGPDEYYIHDIIGMEVMTPEGESLGKIREVIRAPANDVYVTERAMIPAVKEFVLNVDLDNRRMVVRPIPGMVEE